MLTASTARSFGSLGHESGMASLTSTANTVGRGLPTQLDDWLDESAGVSVCHADQSTTA